MRDRDYRRHQQARHLPKTPTRAGALKRREVEQLRCAEHRIEIERFYRGEEG